MLALAPNDVKASYRKGKALLDRQEFALALSCLAAAIKANPENEALVKLEHKVQASKVAKNEKDKKLYQRMVSALDGSSPDVRRDPQDRAGTDPGQGGDASSWAAYAGKIAAITVVTLAVLALLWFAWAKIIESDAFRKWFGEDEPEDFEIPSEPEIEEIEVFEDEDEGGDGDLF